MHGMVLGKKDMWPLSIEALTVIIVILIIDIIVIIFSNRPATPAPLHLSLGDNITSTLT